MAKKGRAGQKKIELKAIVRIRVRCKACQGRVESRDRTVRKPPSAWLRRLYVLWATPLVPVAEGEPAPPPVFALAQSDQDGYLTPTQTKLDPNPGNTMAMFPDHEYLFYFVRHPGTDLPERVLDALRADYDAARKEWGEPSKLRPVFTGVGKTKGGRSVTEGVIEIDEDPGAFLKGGSDFYGGWVLFRDMPGTGGNRSDRDLQCPPLREQVRRLQYHLGALRYPIGNQWHPYSPEPWTGKAARRAKRQAQPLYQNEGVFDIKTWNCVLAFQRDAAAGRASVQDPGQRRTRTLAPGSFDPTAEAEDWLLEMRESAAYMSTSTADAGDAGAAIPYDTVVEENTGAAIRTWLEKGLRKPGKILVAIGRNQAQYDSWMQEDALPVITALGDELAALGFEGRARFASSFRDTRMSVDSPGAGQIVTSIHKSGFAFDFLMSKFVGPKDDYPIYFVRDEASATRVRWIVYAAVPTAKIPPPPHAAHVEYVETIEPWMYNPLSPDGGQKGLPLTLPGHLFLNLTRINDRHGLIRISAHKTGWQFVPPVEVKVSSLDEFRQLLAHLRRVIGDASLAVPNEAVFNGTEKYPLGALKGFLADLTVWLKAAARYGATPEVYVTPNTKEGDAFLRVLRSRKFRGRKLELTVFGDWDGGEGAEHLAKAHGVTTANITLGPGTEFPDRHLMMFRPLTEPVVLKVNTTVSLPGISGTPQHMEWWHFQLERGYSGKTWGDILAMIGWTPEGLVGRQGHDDQGIYGLTGLGYQPGDLKRDAS